MSAPCPGDDASDDASPGPRAHPWWAPRTDELQDDITPQCYYSSSVASPLATSCPRFWTTSRSLRVSSSSGSARSLPDVSTGRRSPRCQRVGVMWCRSRPRQPRLSSYHPAGRQYERHLLYPLTSDTKSGLGRALRCAVGPSARRPQRGRRGSVLGVGHRSVRGTGCPRRPRLPSRAPATISRSSEPHPARRHPPLPRGHRRASGARVVRSELSASSYCGSAIRWAT